MSDIQVLDAPVSNKAITLTDLIGFNNGGEDEIDDVLMITGNTNP